MIEQNSIVKLHSICLTVVNKDPECVLLGNSIGGTRIEGGGLGLGDFADLSVEFGGGSLVKLDCLLEATGTYCVEHTKDTDSVTVSGVFGHVEGYLYVTHGSKIVNFSGTYVSNDGNEICCIAKISVVKEELDSGLMPVFVNVIDTSGVEDGSTTNDSVNLFEFGLDGYRWDKWSG